MNVTRPNFTPANILNRPSTPPPGGENPGPSNTPSTMDNVADGVSSWSGKANTLIGVYNGGVAGFLAGGAIGLGGSAIGAASTVLHGGHLTWGTLAHTAGSAGTFALGGGAIGGLVGGVATHTLGKVVGNFGAGVASKVGASENVGRAIGTVGTGVALGTLTGLGVAGYNGAVVAFAASAIGACAGFVKK